MHTNTTAYRHAVVMALVAVLLLGFTTAALSADEPKPDHPGRDQGIDPGTVLIRRTFAGSQAQGGAPDWVAVPVRPGESPEQAAERLKTTPGVHAVSLNYRYELFAASPPDDPYFPDQWHLSDVGVPDAWEFGEGDGVTLAIIDAGVSAGGEDLACHTFRFPYNSSNGAPSSEPDPNNPSGSHGTHVAGTALQCSNNGIRAAGMAPGADLLPVRVSDSSNAITSEYLADGVIWAADHGADVINMSLGKICRTDWPICGEEDQALNDAIDYAAAKDIVIVGASGNYSQDFVAYPANHPAVIAVGATTVTRSIATYSNTGSALDLAAPGGGDVTVDGILQESFDDSTGVWGVYAKFGTSFASPLVAGTATLMRAANPALSSSEVREILRSTALDLGTPGWDSTYGAGLLQAQGAVVEAAAVGGPGVPSNPALFSACPDSAHIPDSGFTDTAGLTAEADIDCIAYYGVTTGTSPTTYSPDNDVLRWQMALFLTRMATSAGVVLDPTPPDAGFTDIGHLPAARQLAINQLVEAGIVKGTSPTTYSPDAPVIRKHMALFLTRFLGEAITGPGGVPLSGAAVSGAPFTDIGHVSHEAFVAINQLWDLVITTGTTPTTYSPSNVVERDQMSLFLARTMDHANSRPAGVNIQAYPMIVEDDPLNPAAGPVATYSVTVRTADFSPDAGVHVDAFYFAADEGTDTPFNADGSCDLTKAALTDPGGSPVCRVTNNDKASDPVGNFATTTILIDSAFLPLYAWTGDDLALFNANTTTFSSVVIGATSTTP